MNGLQSRHVEPEGTSIDSLPSSPPPIQMPVAHTLLTTSQDQTTIVPPTITPGTVFVDPHARMDRLK